MRTMTFLTFKIFYMHKNLNEMLKERQKTKKKSIIGLFKGALCSFQNTFIN